MSFNLSVRASASYFTVPMVGIGLVVLRLLGEVLSGLAGLSGLGGKEITSECSEDGSLSEGTGEGVSLVSLEKGASGGRSFDLIGPLSLRVLSLLL